MINLHCHARDMGQSNKATVLITFEEAIKGLIDILGFMPNTEPSLTTIPVLNRYLKLIFEAKSALKINSPQYVWFGVTESNLAECRIALKSPHVIGLKVYPATDKETVNTDALGVACEKTILKAMRAVNDSDKVLAVHCDDPMIISQFGHTIEAEVEYVRKIIFWAKRTPCVRILICHVSSRKSAELILKAQQKNLKIAIELSPHHLWFDKDGTNWNPHLDAAFYKCFNKLRNASDREFLVKLLGLKNQLIIIGSDHAPHTREEKLRGAGGIPNLLEMVPVIITLAIKKEIPEKMVAKLLSFNAANFFKIPVSRDLTKYHLSKKRNNSVYHSNIVNPWEGTELYFPVVKRAIF